MQSTNFGYCQAKLFKVTKGKTFTHAIYAVIIKRPKLLTLATLQPQSVKDRANLTLRAKQSCLQIGIDLIALYTSFPGQPWEVGTRKKNQSGFKRGKRWWGLGCSGISWTICKQCAPCSRQITTSTPHHSILQAGCSYSKISDLVCCNVCSQSTGSRS